MNRAGKEYLEEWSIELEESEDKSQTIMRIRSPRDNRKWFLSDPVTEVSMGRYGWEVHTEKEVFGLVYEILWERKRRYRGWWGSFRERWSVLAERLPEKLKFFARFWEGPPEDEWESLEKISAWLDSEPTREWKNKYKIRENPKLLPMTDADPGNNDVLPEEKIMPNEFFLCFDLSCFNCFGWFTVKWETMRECRSYYYQEMFPDQPAVYHLQFERAYEKLRGEISFSISYRIPEENYVEIVRAVCHRSLNPERGPIPDECQEYKMYIFNKGRQKLRISGVCGKLKADAGEKVVIEVEEV